MQRPPPRASIGRRQGPPSFIQPRPPLRVGVAPLVPLEQMHSELYDLGVAAWARERLGLHGQPLVRRRRWFGLFVWHPVHLPPDQGERRLLAKGACVAWLEVVLWVLAFCLGRVVVQLPLDSAPVQVDVLRWWLRGARSRPRG